MSNNRLIVEGMNELRAKLQALPETLATEAGEIVIAHAEAAKQEIETGYPLGPTGNLRRGVTISRSRSKAQSQAIVRSRAPHAWIFEHGTANRVTNRGWNRGRMPEPTDARRMIPKVIRWRRKMIDALKELVLRHGASEVTE